MGQYMMTIGTPNVRCRRSLPIALLTALLMPIAVRAQTDTIQGVINTYTRMTWMECTNKSTIEVEDPLGFHPGDRILIIQMRGASVDLRDSSVFGTPTYNGAGNYELATVDEIRGRLFTLKYELSRPYTLTEVVQVIRVPVYANVVVAGVVRPKPWNDTSGGVVAFIASGTITLNVDIDATGIGFSKCLG